MKPVQIIVLGFIALNSCILCLAQPSTTSQRPNTAAETSTPAATAPEVAESPHRPSSAATPMNEFQQKLWIALWGALAGGFMSLIVTLSATIALPRLRRWNLTRQISITQDPPHNGNARFGVANAGFWTIADAMLYLYLDIREQDVLPPPDGFQAHIAPGRFVPLRDSGEQLRWSVSPNPMKVDILAKENQPFSPCVIRADFIIIPSESGWGGPSRPEGPASVARVFLRRKVYTGRLTVVTADTNGHIYDVRIDPYSALVPCTIARRRKNLRIEGALEF